MFVYMMLCLIVGKLMCEKEGEGKRRKKERLVEGN